MSNTDNLIWCADEQLRGLILIGGNAQDLMRCTVVDISCPVEGTRLKYLILTQGGHIISFEKFGCSCHIQLTWLEGGGGASQAVGVVSYCRHVG